MNRQVHRLQQGPKPYRSWDMALASCLRPPRSLPTTAHDPGKLTMIAKRLCVQTKFKQTRNQISSSGLRILAWLTASGHHSSSMPRLHWTQEKGYQSLTPGCLSPCSPPQGTRDKDGSGVLQQGLRFIVGDLKKHGWPAGAGPCSWSWPHSPQPPYINRDRLCTGGPSSCGAGAHW